MVLAEDADTGKPIEWVDIDPEAFTGAMFTHFTIYFSHSTHTHTHTLGEFFQHGNGNSALSSQR